MRRLILATGVSLLLASCATTPPTTEQLLLGTWNCEAPIGSGKLQGAVTYAAGGKSTMKLTFSGEMAGAKVEAIGDGDATWALLEDNTKLESRIGNLTLTSVKMGDQVIAPAMAQAMIGPMLAGQSAVSTINVDKTNLTLTATDGTATSCTR
jgi:hypothetical protein